MNATLPPPQPAPRPHAEPFSAGEIAAAARQPLRMLDLVLSAPQRVAANVAGDHSLGALGLVFLLASALFAIPYGFVLGLGSWWRVVVLYLGSTLICLPSLHVFASYLGLRARPAQILVLALTIPSVAALFTFGFAPILGFLRATMDPDEDHVSWRALSSVLLSFALAAGVVQLWRCFLASPGVTGRGRYFLVLLGWHAVFVHVLLRMGHVLGLGG